MSTPRADLSHSLALLIGRMEDLDRLLRDLKGDDGQMLYEQANHQFERMRAHASHELSLVTGMMHDARRKLAEQQAKAKP